MHLIGRATGLRRVQRPLTPISATREAPEVGVRSGEEGVDVDVQLVPLRPKRRRPQADGRVPASDVRAANLLAM